MDRIEIFGQSIGSGAYGDVFNCSINGDDSYAVKKCSFKDKGFNIITEMIILNSLRHRYINQCVSIYFLDDNIYMIQKRAPSDLSYYLKSDVYTKIDQKILKKWTWQLTKAVEILHHYNIIHCDIKPRNILIDETKNIRLTDFGLSVIFLDRYKTHITGTPSYRPIENFLREPFDFSLDIWSLGCCFHQILFGHNVFPKQEIDNKLTEEERNRIMEKKYINCILDWDHRGNPTMIPINKLDIKILPISFTPFTVNPGLENDQMLKYLIYGCLKMNPKERINITEILSSDFFKDFPKEIEYFVNDFPEYPVSQEQLSTLEEILDKISETNNQEKKFIIKIFSKIPPEIFNVVDRSYLSVFIFSKFVYDVQMRESIIKQKLDIIKLEAKFFSENNFCFLIEP